MLDQPLEAIVEVKGRHLHQGRPRFEVALVSEDGQTLYFHEGQLKEIAVALEVGKRYRAVFQPFVNNRWLEVKLVRLEPVT